MGITAISGPGINYGITLSSSGAVNEYNEDRGPSLVDLGEGTMDPRQFFSYKPGNRAGTPVYGWAGAFGGPVVDFVPIASNSSGIALSQSSTGAASGQITVTSSANSSSFRLISAFQPSSGGASVSVVMIDGFQGGFAVGQGSTGQLLGQGCGFGSAGLSSGLPSGTVQLWNPLVMCGRGVTISSTGNASGATFTIAGFDVYGLFMTASLTGPNNSTVTTLKAFKYILSSGVTWSGGAGSSSVSVGVSDIYGFPLYVDHPAYATIWTGPSSGATLVSLSTGAHVFGFGSSLGTVPTSITFPTSLTSTPTTPDVRGTFNSTAATAISNGTAASSGTANRITMNISPKVTGLGLVTQSNTWGLTGLPQA
jgi:hypothetical protein